METTDEATPCPVSNLPTRRTVKLGAKAITSKPIKLTTLSSKSDLRLPHFSLAMPPHKAPITLPTNNKLAVMIKEQLVAINIKVKFVVL